MKSYITLYLSGWCQESVPPGVCAARSLCRQESVPCQEIPCPFPFREYIIYTSIYYYRYRLYNIICLVQFWY